MTTPTKEQINIVAAELAMYMFFSDPWLLAEKAIATWEKIKNSHK